MTHNPGPVEWERGTILLIIARCESFVNLASDLPFYFHSKELNDIRPTVTEFEGTNERVGETTSSQLITLPFHQTVECAQVEHRPVGSYLLFGSMYAPIWEKPACIETYKWYPSD